MHALAVHARDDVRFYTIDKPTPGPTDAVVRVRACGICDTDLALIRAGGMPRYEGGPMVLGHEAVGEIIAVGGDTHGIAIGQRVVITPTVTAARAFEGAFSEELLVRDAQIGTSLLAIPDMLPDDIAALTEPLAVALHAVHRADPKPREKVVVFGCGPIGLGIIFWLRERRLTDIVAVDIAPEPVARARRMGAHATIDLSRCDLRETLAALHGSATMSGRTAVGTHIYIDAAGAPTILPQVVDMARKHARVVVVAAHREPVMLSLGDMLKSEMSITTAMGQPVKMQQVLDRLPALRQQVAGMISHRFPFTQALTALEVAATPASAKVMVQF